MPTLSCLPFPEFERLRYPLKQAPLRFALDVHDERDLQLKMHTGAI